MKFLCVVASCLLAGGLTASACTIVEVPFDIRNLPQQKVKRDLMISVTANNRSMPGMNLAVYTMEGHVLFYARSDAAGIVSLKHLKPGLYHVASSAVNSSQSDLVLDVAPSANGAVDRLTMNLTGFPLARDRAFAEVLRAPVAERVPSFSGVVTDPTGAVISGSTIEIYRDGHYASADAERIVTDENGKFSKQLSEGTYRALARKPGFAAEFIVFQIEPKSISKNISVSLKLCGCEVSF